MKTRAFELSAGCVKSACLALGFVGILFGGTTLPAAELEVSAGNALHETAPTTNMTAEFPAGEGLRMNFRNVPLETVLNYMSKAAGYVIHPEVALSGRVDVWSDQPLSKEDALALLEHVLSDSGYAVTLDGRLMTIFSASDTRHRNIPVIKFTRVEDIPPNAEVATYIIPVRTLNPVALVNNLRPLISTTSDLQANESANSLLVTDSKINIRRLADIVMQLDSVSSSINSIEVYPIKYADAKSLADLVKQLFPAQQTSGNAPSVGGFFGLGGGAGAFGSLFGGGAGGGGGSGSSPATHVTAVSDDHSNSLIVSAPEGLLPTIRELVKRLDQQVEDVTEIRLFHLKNADPNEMATVLGNMFPDTSSSADASQSPVQFGGLGGFGIATPAASTSSGPGQYMKKMASVVTVPDPRTQSIAISASKDMMPQIEGIISRLDEVDSGKLNIHQIVLNNAEPADVMQLIQDLYPAGATTTRQITTQNNPLAQRAQTLQQNALSSGAGSGSSSTSSSSSSGNTGGLNTGF